MIVELSQQAPPRLVDLDHLERLHAIADGATAHLVFDDTCRPGSDDDHVLVSVAWLRNTGVAQVDDPEWLARFEATMLYADSKGWLDAAGAFVHAHIEH